MKDNLRSNTKSLYLFGAVALVFGLAFLMAVAPAFASSAFQVATGSATVVGTVASTSAAPTSGATAAAPTSGATALAPTAAATSGAPTSVASLAAPAAGAGTPTALVPVTGADLTNSGDQTRVLLEVLAGLVGLLLITYGVFSRLAKRYNR